MGNLVALPNNQELVSKLKKLDELDKEKARIEGILYHNRPEGLTEDAAARYKVRLNEIEKERVNYYPANHAEFVQMSKLAEVI